MLHQSQGEEKDTNLKLFHLDYFHIIVFNSPLAQGRISLRKGQAILSGKVESEKYFSLIVFKVKAIHFSLNS